MFNGNQRDTTNPYDNDPPIAEITTNGDMVSWMGGKSINGGENLKMGREKGVLYILHVRSTLAFASAKVNYMELNIFFGPHSDKGHYCYCYKSYKEATRAANMEQRTSGREHQVGGRRNGNGSRTNKEVEGKALQGYKW